MVFKHTLHLCIPLCECVMRYWRFVWRFAFEVAQHGRRREEGGCQHGGCEMQTKLKSVNLSHVVSSGTETEDRRLTERGGGGERKGAVGRTYVLLSLRALLWLSV